MKPVYVARDPKEKAMQRALLQWKRPEKRALVIQALKAAGREDLIGFQKSCLVRPMHGGGSGKAPGTQRPQEKRGQPGNGKKPPQGRSRKGAPPERQKKKR